MHSLFYSLICSTSWATFIFFVCFWKHWSVKYFTGIRVDLDVDGHEDIRGTSRVSDTPSGDNGGSSSGEFISCIRNLDSSNLAALEKINLIRVVPRVNIPTNYSKSGREPWSGGYGRRLMFRRSWVWIPALYTGWTFSHLFVVKVVMMFVWKDKKKRKRGRGWPIFLKKYTLLKWRK